MIVLVALALVGGAAAVSNVEYIGMQEAGIFSWWKSRNEKRTEASRQQTPQAAANNSPTQPLLVGGVKGDQSVKDKQMLGDIERQLTMAIQSGGMSPYNYRSLDSKLKSLERKKVDTKKARELMKKVSVGGTPTNLQKDLNGQARTASPAANSQSDTDILRSLEQGLQTALKSGGISPQEHKKIGEQLKALESKKVNTVNARAMYVKLSVGGTEPSKPASVTNNFENAGAVWWRFEHDKNKWVPQGTPPSSCPPLVFASPIDVSKARAVLYPGQQRGLSIQDYKAHGGFLLSSGDIEVRMPYDGYVMQGARFLQEGHIQYALDMISECGILQRFGHLYELTPKFQAIVEKFPEPKENDSRTTPVRPMIKVMKGELIATKVGVPSNPGMDWGVMDLRTENKAAQDAAYREKYAWQRGYAYHGLCWLDYLSAKDQALAKALPGGDGRMGKTSDYCKNAGVVTPTTPSVRTDTPPRAGGEEERGGISFDSVRQEIEDAEKSGGRFSEEHSERVLRSLASFESAGQPKAEIERLRTIVKNQSPHIADEARAAAAAEAEAAKADAKKACAGAPPPVLTHDITDLSKVQNITAPGSTSFEGPKGHSFINTLHARVPLYAPAAAIYDSGSYTKDSPESPAQYLLFFRVKDGCGYQFKFDHADELVPALTAELFPAPPKVADSRPAPATKLIEFAAGELIGYTTGTPQAGNWDFGLYNMNEEGKLAAHGSYGTHRHSVCWPDYFTADKKAVYRRLLEGPRLVCSF